MASKKHLKPTTSSSDDEDEEMETSAGEEEAHNSNESSSEDEEPTKEKQQKTLTPPSSVVAATETKRDKKKEKVCGGSGEAKPSTKKRPREVTSMDDVSAKRLIKDNEKPSVKRLEWSELDEIRVLQGMLDFKAESGKNPILDKIGTYEFVKESLSVDVNRHQFIEKVYNLRKKYFRKRDNGKVLSFSNAHNQKTFDLSKLIWGYEKPKRIREKIKKMEEDKKVMIHEGEDWFYNSFMAKSITSFGGDEDFVKRIWSKVTVEKKKMIEDKWRVLINKDFEALVEKTKFLNEVASAIVQASTH